jgi:hypothetical protein
MLGFNPYGYRCCQHNVAHAWPYFAEHLWLATPGNGLAAVLYAPCEVKAKVGDGTEVTIVEETKYPFEDTIRLKLALGKSVAFPLYLRAPAWSGTPTVRINGQPGPEWRVHLPGYVRIERLWQNGDTVELQLPMSVKVRTWVQNDRSVSVERGPLTYALKIGEKTGRYGGTDAWPAIEILPTTPWNYGLVVDPQDPAKSFEIVTKTWDGKKQPFDSAAAPIELKAKARKIPAWQLDPRCGLVGNLQPSPAKSVEPEETVTLIPMGCARLRIASFPTVGTGPDTREWVEGGVSR